MIPMQYALRRRTMVKRVPSNPPIGSLPVGTKIYLNVGGVGTVFFIVHQGIPSTSDYDSSCTGTWVMSWNAFSARKWDAAMINRFDESDMFAYLNGTWLSSLDDVVQSAIKQVKIPYYVTRRGYEGQGTTYQGANGMSAKIFLPSGRELGGTGDHVGTNTSTDGERLSYFESYNDSKRKAGNGVKYYTRTPRAPANSAYTYVVTITESGGIVGNITANTANAFRPVFILPTDFTKYSVYA